VCTGKRLVAAKVTVKRAPPLAPPSTPEKEAEAGET
jgi:hypothetical protein